MGVIAGESPRSSRASSNFGDGRDLPASRHSSSDSSFSRTDQPRFQPQPEDHNSPYLPPPSPQSASPASSQEGISNPRYLAAPGMQYRRSPRPSSVYSSMSDIRNGSPQRHSRAVSGQSYESRRASYTELPHMQPPPPVLTGNAHLKGVIGSNASLLSSKQTLEMYRANAKKTNDPSLQYELAVFMVGAAQQQEILASEGGRAPKRDLDSPYVDTSAAQSKAELLKEAKGILERLLNKLPQAQYYLADAYASGLFTNGKVENEKAFPLFVAASKHGHAEAGYRAALCYEFGWGCRADPAKAVQFYRQSASKNHPGAMTRLGKACLRDDLGLSGRCREGVKWLKRATDIADHQYPNAPYELGLLHETGYGDDIFQDLGYAAQLFTKAADLGHMDAYYRMGDAYEHGKLKCPRDAALSVHFYTGAAQRGHPLAMMALCAWYMVGAEPVLEKNEDEAYQWALKAAETGLAKAEYAVGYFTEMGIGCRRDPLEANVWYVKAADHGDKRAKDRLAVIQAAVAGATLDKKGKKKKDSPNKLEGRRPSGDKECSIM
ncbi:Sel1-like protein [Tirmania nivea]|nr:Sel1-like protein [Tirmania nivea]